MHLIRVVKLGESMVWHWPQHLRSKWSRTVMIVVLTHPGTEVRTSATMLVSKRAKLELSQIAVCLAIRT